MLVENQLVEVKWNNLTKRWYEDRGYVFTKQYDTFYVRPEDLTPSTRRKVKVECDCCGKIYELAYADYLKNIESGGYVACNSCKGKKIGNTVIQKYSKSAMDYFYNYCKERGYTPISTDKTYTGVDGTVEFICPKHGKQSIIFRSMYNSSGCPKCGIEKNADHRRLSIDKARQYIESLNNNTWLNPDEYINSQEKNLKIRCGSCGKTYITRMTAYKYINTGKCPVCGQKRSRAEYRIATFLEKNNVNFIQEKYFEDCKDKQALLFDFYLPDYNLCIEFDGQQHFEPKFGIDSFVTTKLHDAMKDNYCRWNKIDLLRISYLEGNNIEQIISEKLNLHTAA